MHDFDDDKPRSVNAIAQDLIDLIADTVDQPPDRFWRERRDVLMREAKRAGMNTGSFTDKFERWT